MNPQATAPELAPELAPLRASADALASTAAGAGAGTGAAAGAGAGTAVDAGGLGQTATAVGGTTVSASENGHRLETPQDAGSNVVPTLLATDLAKTLHQAIGLLQHATHTDLAALADEELCHTVGAIEQAGRLIDTLRILGAGEVDFRSPREAGPAGLAQRHGHTRTAHFLEQLTRISGTEAIRRVRLGAAILPSRSLTGDTLPATFPVLAAAMIAGSIGADAARHITACLTTAAPTADGDSLDAAEQALVETATTEPAELVALHARVWREHLDPDGAEPREEIIRRRRAFRLGRETDGITPFTGAADPMLASLLKAAFSESLSPAAQPRFLDDTDTRAGTTVTTSPDGDLIETLTDPRTPDQKRHDILTGMLTSALRNSTQFEESGQPGSLRPTATVSAVITLADLEAGRGVGWIDDHDNPVPARSIRELACEGGITPILLGNHGEVLQLGRTRRLFSPTQRRALAVRDGGCVWPSCTAPPSWCHAHHITEWNNGGTTDIDNGAIRKYTPASRVSRSTRVCLGGAGCLDPQQLLQARRLAQRAMPSLPKRALRRRRQLGQKTSQFLLLVLPWH